MTYTVSSGMFTTVSWLVSTSTDLLSHNGIMSGLVPIMCQREQSNHGTSAQCICRYVRCLRAKKSRERINQQLAVRRTRLQNCMIPLSGVMLFCR